MAKASSRKKGKSKKASGKTAAPQNCSVPEVPEREIDSSVDPLRASLIRIISKKWANGTNLHYHFLGNKISWRGSAAEKRVVRDSFKKWKSLGIGLLFKEVPSAEDAEIRIGFMNGDGSWSYVGRDNIDYAGDPKKRTMNFGWDVTTPYGRDTALHEIGHALGFSHEHQNGKAGIVWDEVKVLQEFSGPPNKWDENKIRRNILNKLPNSDVEASPWDRDSIMHYHFRAGLIIKPAKYQNQPLLPAPGLSSIDKSRVKKFYPVLKKNDYQKLEPFHSIPFAIGPGEQLNFNITPTQTQSYTIQTFGRIDTVMVLFEDTGNKLQYMQGDDDGGEDWNSSITARLQRGHSYVVRMRLYYSDREGESALMMW